MIKHIFCDLDGTLLRDFKEIHKKDIDALIAARNQGKMISIATGRLDYEIKMLMDKYDFKGYRISQNGAVVFDDEDELVYEQCLAYDDVLLILEALKDQNVLIFYQTADRYIVEEKHPIMVEFEKSQPFITYIENKNIGQELEKHEFVTISLWAEKNVNIRIKKILDRVLPSHLIAYISSEYTIDITSRINSKGNAIKAICDKKGIRLNEIAVIGDSHNDISMFHLTDESYVMKEARTEVMKEANFIVEDVKSAINTILNK